jgi:hypothetical protein
LLDRFAAAGVPITTASDTHGLSHIADRSPLLESLAVAAGYSTLRAFRGREGYDVALGHVPETLPAPVGEIDLTDDKSLP